MAIVQKKGWAADKAFNTKMSKYSDLSSRNGLSFIPQVFESTGYIRSEVLDLVKRVCQHASETRKIPAEVLFQYHIKSLSVVLQRSNAETQLNRADTVCGSALLPGVRNLMRYVLFI